MWAAKRPTAASPQSAIGGVGELQAKGRRQVAREFEILRDDIAEGGQHADAAVLQLRSAAALEGVDITVRRQTKRVQEPHRLCTPSSVSKAPPGSHLSGPVVPKKSFCETKPVMATMARRALVIGQVDNEKRNKKR